MTKISMKLLLGASTAAMIAAISLAPATHAQDQPGYANTTPQAQPAPMAAPDQQNGYAQPQTASVPQTQGTTDPSALQQMNPRYPGPKLN
jgi:uncharacterized lipoprotein